MKNGSNRTSRQMPPQRTTPPVNGSGSVPNTAPKRRPRGPRAAANRALQLRRGLGDLPPHREALLRVTARLIVHLENASDRLFREGELTADGHVRALLPRVLDLSRQVRENLALLGADADVDPFGGAP